MKTQENITYFQQSFTPSIIQLLFGLFILTLLFSVVACDDDDPPIPIDPEVITTLIYTLTPTDGGTSVVLNFQDLDGDGGNAPTITGGTLSANTTYTGAIVLSNESESPAEDITAEITEEAEEHQFFFQTHQGLDLSVTYADSDADSRPIGLATTLTTAAASSGHLIVTLRHEPDKSADGVAGGDITNAGGETDIEVQFDVVIE